MDKKTEIEISKRQESNRVLVQLITDMVEKYPDLRFHQILHSLDIVIPRENMTGDHEDGMQDLFYEESVKTLDRVSKAVEKLN